MWATVTKGQTLAQNLGPSSEKKDRQNSPVETPRGAIGKSLTPSFFDSNPNKTFPFFDTFVNYEIEIEAKSVSLGLAWPLRE